MVGEVYGVDVSWESLRLAAQAAPVARFVQFDGKMLPFANATFDAVIASCVLHHVPPAERSHFVAEMVRPLRQGGIALIIEHNALNPVTRRIVSRCAFDADAVLLTCREAIELFNGHASVSGWRYMGFVPFRNTLVERAEGAFGWLPIGAQYLVWAKKTG
jgi:ubiquinone/menaquinone biosynthesis C-methylase UbiE